MAVHVASTPLPPNVHVVYEVLCSEGPRTGGELELLLEKRGVGGPAGPLLELPPPFPRGFTMDPHERLLVGERSAMLLGAPVGPRVLVPDSDLADPVRRRLRALAAALHFPPEIGLRLRGQAPQPPAAGPFTAWLEVRETVTWSWLPDGGSEVDQGAGDALPDAEGPPVEGEGLAGLATLLARLRAEVPPPPVGALEVTPVLEVTHVEVTADGLERRRERHAPSGSLATSVERVPFEPGEHPTDSPARP